MSRATAFERRGITYRISQRLERGWRVPVDDNERDEAGLAR